MYSKAASSSLLNSQPHVMAWRSLVLVNVERLTCRQRGTCCCPLLGECLTKLAKVVLA